MVKPHRKNEKGPKEKQIPINKKNNKKDIPIKKKKKKIRDRKSLGEVLISRKPNTSLSTIVKKRYPTLSDRLKSLDRCLTVVHLFAALPAVESKHIEVKCIQRCRRLSHGWQAYIASTNSLRKVQTDKRRTLYQVEVKGHTISYSTPCALHKVFTGDFKVILVFLEFYEVLLGSVLKRLYGLISVRYPLDCNSDLEVLETDHAVSIYVAGQTWMLTDESDLRLAQLQHALTEFVWESSTGSIGENKDDEFDDETKDWRIFKNLKIFLNPEVPKESLLFVITAFGGEVSWKGGPFTEAESDIMHQICERPTKTSASRVCVHTQWVYDCVSRLGVLPARDYLVGREPSSYTASEELKGDVPGNTKENLDSPSLRCENQNLDNCQAPKKKDKAHMQRRPTKAMKRFHPFSRKLQAFTKS